jgi:hypothetical protein
VSAVETLYLEARWKIEQRIVRYLVISQQVFCRLSLSLQGDETFLVDDRRDVIAERQSVTSFLLETIY